MTPIVPFAARLYRPLEPYAYTLIRVATGAIFIPHGVLKLFFGGATSAMGYGFGILELVGGLAIALGLGTRIVAFMMAIELGVIVVAIQMPNGYFWTSRGAEFALVLFVVCVAFVIGGGGRYSLDRKLGREF